MSDKWFFSACLALGFGMLFLALSPFKDRLPTGAMSAGGKTPETLIVKDKDLNRFVEGDVGRLSLNNEEGEYFLTVGVESGKFYDVPTFGPYLALEADLELAYANHDIIVTIHARKNKDSGDLRTFQALAFEVNYAANSSDSSGWKRFELTDNYKPYTFTYQPPKSGDGLGNDFLAIRPLSNLVDHKVDIKSITFKRLPYAGG